jgi:predicted nucleotidyltransferase
MARELAILPPFIREAVVRFAAMVRELGGAHVHDIRVFGSYATDDAIETSDVDVAIVIDEVPHLRSGILDAAGRVWFDTEVPLAATVLEIELFEKWRRQERRLVRDILRDGIPA